MMLELFKRNSFLKEVECEGELGDSSEDIVSGDWGEVVALPDLTLIGPNRIGLSYVRIPYSSATMKLPLILTALTKDRISEPA